MSTEGKDDLFSPEKLQSLRLSQDFAAAAPVEKVYTFIPVRKPGKQQFIRVRSGDDWSFETAIFEDEASRESYLVLPHVQYELSEHLKPVCLRLTIAKGEPCPFLWPLRMPTEERAGAWQRWHTSAIDIARRAEDRWLRVHADMSAGGYFPFLAAADLGEPEWPESLEMADYLRLAFSDRVVDSADHPILKQLRGEV